MDFTEDSILHGDMVMAGEDLITVDGMTHSGIHTGQDTGAIHMDLMPMVMVVLTGI